MSNLKGKHLPYSARRYFLSPEGQLFDKDLNQIKPDVNGIVTIDWVLGRRDYSVAVLMVLTYCHIQLPMHHWDRFIPLYIDGDSDNKSIKNITYKFEEPIESEDYPGFYYIPFSLGYVISKDGRIINHTTGKEKVWSITPPNVLRNSKGGYRYTRVIDDRNKTRVLLRHRALCYTFKNYDRHVHENIVNHLSGVPGDDDLGNLEWSTFEDNATHALMSGLRVKIKPVIMKDLNNGDEKFFQSAAMCGKTLGYTSGDPITNAIRKRRVLKERYIVKYDGDEWFDMDDISYGDGADIVARNVFTGERILFNGVLAGNRLTGVSSANIDYHLKTGKDIPVSGFNFRYLKDSRPFPKHTDRHLEIYKKYPKKTPNGVIFIDVSSGEELFYPSVHDAGEEHGISPQRIHWHIKSKNLYGGKYRIEVFYIRENLGLLEE